MFLNQKITTYTGTYSEQTEKAKEIINKADAVVIGAGAGLSSSAGLLYGGERFYKNFPDFIEKYHFSDMYTAAFQKYDCLEEYWAYWSRHIYLNRYCSDLNNTYDILLNLIKNKDYFVITTNTDHLFIRSGFAKKRLFYTQGDYGLWQCSEPCHNRTYDNKETVMKMVKEQKNMRIPSDLIPYCPVCSKPMTMNLRSDNRFVEDEGWYDAENRYFDFIRNHYDKHTVYLELGIGGNTPSIIKYPFWRFTNDNKNAEYICINKDEAFCPQEIASKSITINEDIHKALTDIYNNN